MGQVFYTQTNLKVIHIGGFNPMRKKKNKKPIEPTIKVRVKKLLYEFMSLGSTNPIWRIDVKSDYLRAAEINKIINSKLPATPNRFLTLPCFVSVRSYGVI